MSHFHFCSHIRLWFKKKTCKETHLIVQIRFPVKAGHVLFQENSPQSQDTLETGKAGSSVCFLLCPHTSLKPCRKDVLLLTCSPREVQLLGAGLLASSRAYLWDTPQDLPLHGARQPLLPPALRSHQNHEFIKKLPSPS